MKLCRFGAAGHEKPGMIDAAGRIRDLSGHVADIDPAAISVEGLARLATLSADDLPLADTGARYGPPVTGTRKFIAIGLNYADHAAESNLPIPEEPVVFNKWVNCIQGPNDPVTIPRGSKKTDWEVELGIVIGTGGLGHVGIQILKALSGAQIIALDVSDEKLELATHVGADHVLISDEHAADRIREITGGLGANAVFDFVGAPPTVALATSVAASEADVTLVGIGGGTAQVGFGSIAYDAAVRVPYWGSRSELIEVLDLARSGRVSVETQRYSLDDGPAAPRYTEARLAEASLAMTRSLDEDVVDFVPNYDNQLMQPEVLPAAFPNLLVNGASGIAEIGRASCRERVYLCV